MKFLYMPNFWPHAGFFSIHLKKAMKWGDGECTCTSWYHKICQPGHLERMFLKNCYASTGPNRYLLENFVWKFNKKDSGPSKQFWRYDLKYFQKALEFKRPSFLNLALYQSLCCYDSLSLKDMTLIFGNVQMIKAKTFNLCKPCRN